MLVTLKTDFLGNVSDMPRNGRRSPLVPGALETLRASEPDNYATAQQ